MGIIIGGDRTLYNVPLSVRKNAKAGLELRRKSKRGNDIRHSFEVATALITGRISKDILLKMALFFKEQSQSKTATSQQLLLWGGESGLKFVLEHVKDIKNKVTKQLDH